MISTDSNVIMAYLNEEDTFYAKARVFTKKNQRRNYILLATVSNSFIHTYQEKVKTAGTIIVQETLKYKKERTKSERSPDYDHIARMVELRIEQRFEDVVEKQPSHNKESLMNFKELLLTDISLIQLFNQQEKIGECRETFINNAQKYAEESINKFLSNFDNIKLMKKDDYDTYHKNIDRIDFEDHEDKLITAELITFTEENQKLSFLTFDSIFERFLKRLETDHDFTIISNTSINIA